MPYYSLYTSTGSLPANNNLQLYSLKQAANSWNPLVIEFMALGEDGVHALKERQTFVVNCLGLSLSQLLGPKFTLSRQAKNGSTQRPTE